MIHSISLLSVALLGLLTVAATQAAEPPTPAERDAIIEKLKARKINVTALTLKMDGVVPAIGLGTGPDGSPEANANDETLALVVQLPEIERIFIYGGKFSADGFAKLALLPKLRWLDIYGSDIAPKTFVVLTRLKTVETLRIQNCPVTDEILGYAGAIRGLKTVEFNKTQGVTAAGFLKFLNAVEGLESLQITGDHGDFLDDACMARIGEMKGMKRFWTMSKTITSRGWAQLAGLTGMNLLWVSGTSFGDDDMRAIEGMKELGDLVLSKTRITDSGMKSLAGLTRMHNLILEGTKITDAGMVHLKGMTELDNLYVGETEVTAKGLSVVPKKERMSMMRTGKKALTPNQLDELMTMYPQTQIFDPAGYWTEERIKVAMKELGKEWPPKKK